MSDKQRDREERQHVIEVLEMLKKLEDSLGEISGNKNTDVSKALGYAISSLKTDLKYDLMYEGASETKSVTTKQLEKMYEDYEKSLWREHEDVRGDDMVEMGTALTLLQEELCLLGCWDEEVEE